MVEAVIHWPLTAQAQTQTPESSFGTYRQQSGTGTAVSPKYYGFCLSSSHQFTILIYLSLMMY